ncbi:hypothetical protein ACLOJK_018030 [Asimina triloba]
MNFKCDLETHSIVEIRLEELNLKGEIDADSLCKLPLLQVLSLAKNHIAGKIPESISKCVKLTHLNLSSNLLNGQVPASLTTLKNLRSLDISKNSLLRSVPNFAQAHKHEHASAYIMESNITIYEKDDLDNRGNTSSSLGSKSSSETPHRERKITTLKGIVIYVSFFLVLACCLVLLIVASRKRAKKSTKENEIQEFIHDSPDPIKILTSEEIEEPQVREEQMELAFFIEKHEQFKIEELLGSAADLQGQSLCSSLFKVTLRENKIFAIKRLKKLNVSMAAFGKRMRWVGNLKHLNLLPLIAYHSSNDDKLLIYGFQRNRSLLYLLENYEEGRRDFPWRHRLSVASGIIRGLDCIYRNSEDEPVPHGNLKLSNILLGENEEPLISEYGFQQFIDPKRAVLYSSNGYKAPEKSLTEKADIFSFGVILLELLTGKTIERTGLDLPKWVRSKVRAEWTGEVFDKEVNRMGSQWAFPLLNIALQCVSQLPEQRPNIAEVLDKIEEAMTGLDDYSSSISSTESMQ